ncbi:hypothetical protein NDS46_16590 [Paenibacillus thiaminolyticus]|uniref:hypothetical protein n=1 Tax=Paenibacillus thiaminolyticus TaxID=49283 RepID=UPI00232EB135|nr:hypothetical protein [Paenibacillus thiaminolyticus]WCF05987.1 hypothetical protein NDS46_16590 [Paenibacillus thiaminolyticus]
MIKVPKHLPLTTSLTISIAAEQDEADISREGIPVYGTVSIGTIELLEPMLGGATEHSLKVGKEGGTGWLALQAIVSHETLQTSIRAQLLST